DAVALLDGERQLTWRGYVAQRNRLGNALSRLGLAKGEHVIVYVQNSLETVLVPAAVRAVGAIPVPMNHRLVADEVLYILDHSDARAVFVGDLFLRTVERIRPAAVKVRSWILVGSERRSWSCGNSTRRTRSGRSSAAGARRRSWRRRSSSASSTCRSGCARATTSPRCACSSSPPHRARRG